MLLNIFLYILLNYFLFFIITVVSVDKFTLVNTKTADDNIEEGNDEDEDD